MDLLKKRINTFTLLFIPKGEYLKSECIPLGPKSLYANNLDATNIDYFNKIFGLTLSPAKDAGHIITYKSYFKWPLKELIDEIISMSINGNEEPISDLYFNDTAKFLPYCLGSKKSFITSLLDGVSNSLTGIVEFAEFYNLVKTNVKLSDKETTKFFDNLREVYDFHYEDFNKLLIKKYGWTKETLLDTFYLPLKLADKLPNPNQCDLTGLRQLYDLEIIESSKSISDILDDIMKMNLLSLIKNPQTSKPPRKSVPMKHSDKLKITKLTKSLTLEESDYMRRILTNE